MKLLIFAPVSVIASLAFLTEGAHGALPLAHPGPTVDDYSAAQSQRAEKAGRGAGFGDLEIVMVQDGNFFLNGQKQGKAYNITVTRDGQVYPSGSDPLKSSSDLPSHSR